eukprot:4954753-Prorocentrum_lima.AAC.1
MQLVYCAAVRAVIQELWHRREGSCCRHRTFAALLSTSSLKMTTPCSASSLRLDIDNWELASSTAVILVEALLH